MPKTGKPAPNRSVGYAIIADLIAAFPDAPAKTLARKAFAENPQCWSSLESCRRAVRVQLGVAGSHARRTLGDKSNFREPRKAGWSDVIPEAIEQIEGWAPLEIAGPHRALVLSDLHIPYHDPTALELSLSYGYERNPTLILLNGDLVDHYAMSRWETDPKQRDFPGEVLATIQFLTGLRKWFPKARLVVKMGNHEERFDRWMRFKAPELLGVKAFEWDSIFELEKNKIELVRQKRPIRLGKLNILHGHEHQRTISAPVNPARGLFLRCKTNALCGHWHQASSHSEKNVEGKVITTWSTGCLCDTHPEYAPINSWSQGAAFVTVDKDGAFQVDNFRIVNGKIW